MGMCVREGFRFRALPAGTIWSTIWSPKNLGNCNADDCDWLARLPVAEVDEGGGLVSARLGEGVVERRFWAIRNGGIFCARAILCRQGRHTDPNEDNWNSVRFMAAALYIEVDGS